MMSRLPLFPESHFRRGGGGALFASRDDITRLLEREALGSTEVGDGVALPPCPTVVCE